MGVVATFGSGSRDPSWESLTEWMRACNALAALADDRGAAKFHVFLSL